MNSNEFRKELAKLMPGYDWTVHRSSADGYLKATGTQNSGFNRLSTLRVERIDRGEKVRYQVKSAGFGLRAKWLYETADGTLARALRNLQDHYEAMEATYRTHAGAMRRGRLAPSAEATEAP